MNDQEILNAALMSIPSRSEKNEHAVLISTFVQAGTLFKRLSSIDNQIIYGRRGTGKTHTLQFLASQKSPPDNLSTYTDLNSLGSSASIYADTSLTLSHRATTLLRDLLIAVHEEIRRAVSHDSEALSLHLVNPWLSELLDQINTVEVIGETELGMQQENRNLDGGKQTANLGVASGGPSGSLAREKTSEAENKLTTSLKQKGLARYHIKFGGVNSALRSLVENLPVKRLWLLLDEWSSVPLDLQPYLADLLRRCVCNIPKITLKIAALEYRSNFRISNDHGAYIGLELGAEITSIVNVDDYLVFENDERKARDFYNALFAKHIRAAGTLTQQLANMSNESLLKLLVTQKNAFDELVLAAEGVPRDAINIASLAAQQADNRKISIPIVKRAARQWYLTAKKTAVDNGNLQLLLNWIIDNVIGQRRARAFLVPAGTRSSEIDALFDARVLHVIKRDISQPDGSITERYDAFKLDYGCYVHLMATRTAVSSDLSESDIEVPSDDYRAVRRAVLNLTDFYKNSVV
jgi:hypothetical protein